MKLKINYNGFHGRSTTTIVVDGKPGDSVTLTESQARKLARAGCSHTDCTWIAMRWPGLGLSDAAVAAYAAYAESWTA